MGQSVDTDNARTGTWTKQDFGLSEDLECQRLIHTRDQSASVDCQWTWIDPGLCGFVARIVSRSLHGGCGLATDSDFARSWTGHGRGRVAATVSSRTGHGHVCGQVANADCARTWTSCGHGLTADADADWTRPGQ
jgi:hypothetical protein